LVPTIVNLIDGFLVQLFSTSMMINKTANAITNIAEINPRKGKYFFMAFGGRNQNFERAV